VTYLDRFLAFLDTLPDLLIYILLGLSAFVENVFPPAPGDTITAFGAFLVGTNRLQFLSMFISTTIGSLAGFMFLFWIGSLLGRRFFVERDLWYFKTEDIIRAETWFRKYGYFLILINRFLPGIRSVISIVGGLSGLQVFKVFLLALISSGVWNLIWIGMGYSLGSNWETAKARIVEIMITYNVAVLVLLGVGVLFFVTKKELFGFVNNPVQKHPVAIQYGQTHNTGAGITVHGFHFFNQLRNKGFFCLCDKYGFLVVLNLSVPPVNGIDTVNDIHTCCKSS